jgi:hypothetical protein
MVWRVVASPYDYDWDWDCGEEGSNEAKSLTPMETT